MGNPQTDGIGRRYWVQQKCSSESVSHWWLFNIRVHVRIYAFVILKISAITSTWWHHRPSASCQRRLFLQCQMDSRRKSLSLAATSALHNHPRPLWFLPCRHTHTYTQMRHADMCMPRGPCTRCFFSTSYPWRAYFYLLCQTVGGMWDTDLYLKQAILRELWFAG